MTLLATDTSIYGQMSPQSASLSSRSSLVSTTFTGDDTSVIHRPAPTLNPSRTRHDGYGRYVVGMDPTIPHTPSTGTTAPSTPMSSSFRVNEFVDVHRAQHTVIEHHPLFEHGQDTRTAYMEYREENPVRVCIQDRCFKKSALNYCYQSGINRAYPSPRHIRS